MNLMMKIFKLEVYMKGTYFYLYLNIFSLLFDLAYEDKYSYYTDMLLKIKLVRYV